VQSALPVTYQWRFNGADLPGGTNATLIVASVATNQFGNYSVTVSNAFGAVVSLDAVLTEVFVDLSSGLVAYYPFDGDATDASGRGHDAEPHGGVQYAPGQFGLAVALDGVDDFLSTAASADFALSRNFTAAFWCKPEAGSSGFILWNGPDGCADFGYPQTWMAMWGGGNFRFEKCGFAGRWIVGPDMPGGEWTHVAMVVRDDGDAGYLYVNGVMVGSSGAGAPFAVPPTSFVMGRRGPVSAEYYRGLLDEVRVYSRALSDAEVQALYLYESPPIKVPLITHQPSNQSVFVGSSAAFSVTALGADPITYQWLKGGSPIPEATNAILALTNVQPAEVGSYSVLLSNAFGSVTSAPAILRVSTNFSFNVAADFSTNANPNGAWSYGWSPRGSSGFNLFESSGIHPSGGWAMWYMPRPSFLPFVAFNASDNLIAWQTLSIEPHALFLHPGDASENSIVRWTAPASGTVLIDATFKGGDKGGGTTTDVHVLAPNGQSLFDAAVNGFGAASAANWDGSIQVSAGETINFVVGDGGNGYGCDSTVLDATVTLFQTNGPPVIIRQPTNQCVVAGSSVTLSVSAVGAGALTYQWQFNGTDISPATNQILALANVHSTNAGDYRLIVANAYGSVTSAVARLTVVPLIILTQPQSQQVWAGDSATFSVQAYGNSPLSYEWRFNGANIANATNSTLTLANTRLSDTGDYTVVLWNSSGSVTSAVARLTVSPAVPLDHWSSRNSGKSDDLFAITYGNGLFVVVGDEGTILASTNGLNWTDHSVFDGYYLNGVTYGNGLYVAVGDFGGILTSPDAESWTDRSGEVTLADLRDVAYGNGVYVVIGRGGTILISADADTWETIVPDPNRDLNAITFENGIFVVVGQRNGGLILISTNGATWTDASPGTAPNLRGVGAGPDSVVVAGNGGTVLTSTTNSTWAETTVLCPIGRPVNLRACTYGSGAYVVVGNGGAILSSETATNWTCRSSGTTANLHSIAFGQGTYVAVGSDGTILQAFASQPRLSVSCSGTNLELRWPSPMTGYVLESASSLSRSAVWSPVTNQVTVAGSDCITSHGMDSPARFYRLRSP